MEPTIVYILLSSAGLVLGLFLVIWIHSRTQLDIKVPAKELPEDRSAPLISIIVPARNEEKNIRRCVEALLDQTYPNYELIMVDDRSADATPEVLEEIRARRQAGQVGDQPRMLVIHGEELPPDWAGKPYALFQGAEGAGGEWLCFVDADTFASPRLIASTYLAAQEHKADMFSILTDQILGSFWEKVVIPVVFTGLSFGFPANQVNDPQQSNAIANGQFILIKRGVYQSVGGHLAVKNRIDEDKAIAEVVKRSGYRLVLADGRPLARTRMYTNFTELWEGWTKNIFLGMQGRLGLLLFGGLLGLIAALGLPAWLLAGVIWWVMGGGPPAAVVTLEVVVLLSVLLWVRAMAARAFHISPWYAASLPLGAMVFTAMMFTSALKVLTGVGVTWKGRRYKNVKLDS
ncbi:MAG TPA: glycosyltransferase family 2 protein [Anaerolineales bacterium]